MPANIHFRAATVHSHRDRESPQGRTSRGLFRGATSPERPGLSYASSAGPRAARVPCFDQPTEGALRWSCRDGGVGGGGEWARALARTSVRTRTGTLRPADTTYLLAFADGQFQIETRTRGRKNGWSIARDRRRRWVATRTVVDLQRRSSLARTGTGVPYHAEVRFSAVILSFGGMELGAILYNAAAVLPRIRDRPGP